MTRGGNAVIAGRDNRLELPRPTGIRFPGRDPLVKEDPFTLLWARAQRRANAQEGPARGLPGYHRCSRGNNNIRVGGLRLPPLPTS